MIAVLRRVRGRDLGLAACAYLAFLVATVIATIPFLPASRASTFTTPALAVAGTVGYLVLILTTVRFARATAGGRDALALRPTPIGPAAKAVVAAIIIGVLANVVLEPIFRGSEAQGITAGARPHDAITYLWLVLTVAVIVVLGPIAEELYFRGLLFGVLAPLGRRPAVGITALLFAGSHYTLAAIPVISVLGVLLAALRARTGSVWPGIALHVLNNALAVVVTLA